MWYVFPQLDLGTSPISKRYAIRSAAEARGYLAHRILGPRLREITQAAQDCGERDLTELFPGGIDDVKFKACMTLFRLASAGTGDDFFARVASKLCPDAHIETVEAWLGLPDHASSPLSSDQSSPRSPSKPQT